MLAFATSHPYASACGILAVYLLATFFRKLYFYRTLLRGLPQPPHDPVFGHLKVIGEVFKGLPKGCAPQSFPHPLAQKYNLPDAYYLDVWPTGDPILMLSDPDMFNQVAVKPSLPKHWTVGRFLRSFSPPHENLVSSEGHEWKTWRSAFNPGFSSSHLMTFVPAIVDEVRIFNEIIANYARKGEIFRMEKKTTPLTIDIIGRIVLDDYFDAQTSAHPLVAAFDRQVHLLPVGALYNPIELVDFTRPIRQWYNNRIMNRYLSKLLEDRFATRHEREKQKLIIDLALEAYLKEEKKNTAQQAKALDPDFKRIAINQIKVFLFAGHDTTSSTICYAYHLLNQNPETLERIRAEHDAVFGTNVDGAPEKLSQDPTLLNQLPYTTAVIKETLRLYPPASSVRVGQKGVFVHDKDGRSYPTEHFLIWPVNVSYHRNTKSWGPDADLFRPSRFLDPNGIPNKEAFIPFSRGPRNCIGQELAMIESKVILALTVRVFDFKAAYDELDLLKNDGSGYPSDMSGIQEQFGDKAWQIQLGGAKPREGMPCRVKFVERK